MISGYYINLDTADKRRARMEENLAQSNLLSSIKRLRAYRPEENTCDPELRGVIGCHVSHLEALELAKVASGPTLILEDDAIIPSGADSTIQKLLHSTKNIKWDMIFLNQVMPIECHTLIRWMLQRKSKLTGVHEPGFQSFSLNKAVRVYQSGASSYIVSPKSAEMILHAIKDKQIPHTTPIDMAFKTLFKHELVSAFVTFPFVTGLTNDNDSQIDDYSKTAQKDPTEIWTMLSNIFVAGADLRHIKLNHEYGDIDVLLDIYKRSLLRKI